MSISHANLNDEKEKEKKKKTKNQSKIKNQIKNMEEKKNKLDIEIDGLEKDYLKKIAKLLVMTQVHCEIKTDIYDEFNKLGVTAHVKEVEANGNQSFNNN